MSKSITLRELLASGEMLIMPDAYDPISARIIQHAGFKAVQCSGYSISIAACYRSEFDLSLRDNIAVTRRIVEAVDVPVMADGEDGYGGPGDVQDIIRHFIRTGVSGCNIEDLIPNCEGNYSIVDSDMMVEKLIAAREAAVDQGDSDFIINARTDALRAFDNRADGLNEAIKRGNRYLEAGADLAFICYTATLDEVKVLVREISGPISIAAGQPYNTREFSIEDLRQQGVARVSLPTLAIMSAIRGITNSISAVLEPNGFDRVVGDRMCCSSGELAALFPH